MKSLHRAECAVIAICELVLDIYHPGAAATRHRIRLFEGGVHMLPFSSELVVAHYDVSHRFLDPLLRISTFIGEPARHDLHLNLGMWSELGGLELHSTPAGNLQLWRHGIGEITFDLWQSASSTPMLAFAPVSASKARPTRSMAIARR